MLIWLAHTFRTRLLCTKSYFRHKWWHSYFNLANVSLMILIKFLSDIFREIFNKRRQQVKKQAMKRKRGASQATIKKMKSMKKKSLGKFMKRGSGKRKTKRWRQKKSCLKVIEMYELKQKGKSTFLYLLFLYLVKSEN